MQDPIFTGVGVSWGVPGTINVGYGGGTVMNVLQESQSMKKTMQKILNHDGATGAVIGSVRFQQLTSMTVRCCPSASTLALSNGGNVNTILPAIGKEVVISSIDKNIDMDNPSATVWELESVGLEKKFDDKSYWDFELIRNGDNVNTAAYGSTRVSQPIT